MSVSKLRSTYITVTFLYWFASGLPMALLVLIMQARGLNLFQVGLCFATFSATAFIMELPTGGIADVFGRKTASLIAYFSMVAAMGLYLLAFSLPAFLIASMIAGLGRAFITGSVSAWFVDACRRVDPKTDLQKSFAMGAIGQLAGLGFGMLIGSLLPRLFASLPDDQDAILTPLTTSLVASIVVWIIGTIVFATVVKEPAKPERAKARTGWLQAVGAVIGDSVAGVRSDRGLLLLLVPTVCWGFVFASIEAFWQPHFSTILGGIDGKTYLFGILAALNLAMTALGNALAGSLIKKLKGNYVAACLIGTVVQMAAIFALALQTSFIMAAICFWLLYLGGGLMQSPGMALFHLRIPSDKRATLVSVASLVSSMGAMLGSVSLGYLAKTTSIPLTWIVAGSLLPISLLAYFLYGRMIKQSSPKPEPQKEVPSDASLGMSDG